MNNDPTAQKVGQGHIEKLRKCYSNFLPIEAILVSFTSLVEDVLFC